MRRAPTDLPAGVALSVEDLSKRATDVHTLRYTPTLSIATKIRHRREDGLLPAPPDRGDAQEDDDEDGDEDDDEEQFEEAPALPHAVSAGEWVLHGVRFEVAQGEAVAFVGDAESVSALAQILTGMTSPTSGRVVYRGRIGLSSRLAREFARRDMADPRAALRVLARSAGVPRRDRKAWCRAVAGLVEAAHSGPRPSTAADELRVRIPIAASLDPFADTLVIDRVPGRSDPDFEERCLEHLRARLAEGTAVLLACDAPPAFRDLCSRTLVFEDGQIALSGKPEEIAARRSATDIEVPTTPAARAFNADAAIISANVVSAHRDANGLADERDRRLLVELEVANPATSIRWRLHSSGRTAATTEWKPVLLDAPGAYLVTFKPPREADTDGDSELAVEAEVVVGGKRSILRREVAHPPEAADDARDAAVVELDDLTAEWWLSDGSEPFIE